MKLLALFISTIIFLPAASAFGAEGHEIVATIAQMYLKPSVLETVCEILGESNCHLASVAMWADDHRTDWSAPMHYINPLGDDPPEECNFPGEGGWDGIRNRNVLDAIKNVTSVLQRWVDNRASRNAADEALKFLVHFVGDMHQPLHLVLKGRGGTRVPVHFGSDSTNLHVVWDSSLLKKSMRETPRNYSQPLANTMVESALTGERYDPYIRRIMWEGVLRSWKTEVDTWSQCPRTRRAAPVGQMVMGVDINPDGPVACPYHWATPIHKINCDIAWRGDLRSDLDRPDYSGKIGKQRIVERLLAQAGVRLAGILNSVLAG